MVHEGFIRTVDRLSSKPIVCGAQYFVGHTPVPTLSTSSYSDWQIALDIAKTCVQDEGYFPVVVTDSLDGEARLEEVS